ncbi:oligoendopeptidase F [Mogibacterium pumilum]|uniref:Oligopeptidase F n=1 Tax=Mogibacterium pumilum TaxID=86332 RepID=A0A223ASX2_9FIRM|nr:oligoendopeptidase F [Mogibacterium pumilum]ASS38053.1 oligoendopeptidase F [Mogibacterium pumilum]
MNKYELKNRSEVADKDKWNLEAMYPDERRWEEDSSTALKESEEFTSLKGQLTESAENLLNALRLYADMMRKAENAFVYSRMRHDEDNANTKYIEMNNKSLSILAQISANVSFFTPELLEADEAVIKGFIHELPALKEFSFMLDSIMLSKPHVLSSDEERIIAQLNESASAPDEIFTMFNDADLSFGKVLNEAGIDVELTHGNYIQFMESENREVRKNAFEAMYGRYKEFNNSISVMYNYNVKHDTIMSKLRRYKSTLDSELSGERIPLSVYDNLIEAVHKNLPSMHKYMEIRKRALGLDELKMYDIYRPIVKPEGLEYSYEEAVDIACKALEPLGDEYVQTLRKGLTEDRWVDIYENKGKTSGAYSFGSYDSNPYILMNFSGELRDIFTLVHEAGHSMHSYYTRRTQPFVYGGHSIFTAEVASTVNETLLINYLLKYAESSDMKKYLINFYIDEFKSTLFRQTMFAEFEKITHETVENGGSLTAQLLNEEYDKLNTLYYGPAITHDDFIQYEWSRIPHFYRAYYVYQYATGYSAANAIANRILKGGETERDDYLKFLSTGESNYPIELLKIAGVDMSTEEPVLSALSTFASLVDELDKMI